MKGENENEEGSKYLLCSRSRKVWLIIVMMQWLWKKGGSALRRLRETPFGSTHNQTHIPLWRLRAWQPKPQLSSLQVQPNALLLCAFH